MDNPDLSVVIVSWNTGELLRECLGSLAVHLASVEHEVIVVDNASSDDSADIVATEFPNVRLVRNGENVGFGVANNQAMRMADGQWFLLLNSDTKLVDESVAKLFHHVRGERNIGVAQCRLSFPDGRLQHSTHRFPSLRLSAFEDLGIFKLFPDRTPTTLLRGYWDHATERDVDWVIGAFMLMPREVFAETGGFDERLFMYGEDMEWCFRIRARGWRVRYYPSASTLHWGHASADIRWGDERIALCLERDRDFYRERHGRAQTALFMGVHVVGAALRTLYYTLRGRFGGPRAKPYRDMQPTLAFTLRALIALTIGRR